MTDQLAVAHAWPTNAALVVDVFALLDVAGLAGPDAEVLDVTYGDIVRRQLRARRRPSTLTILVPRHLRRGAA